MEINEIDRNALRKNQRSINPNVIGNLVEYKPQHPYNYKRKEPQNTQSNKTDINLVTKELLVNKEDSLDKRLDGSTNCKTINNTNDPKFPKLNSSKNEPFVIKTECPKSSELPIPPEEVEKNAWLNMDKLEVDKMAWIFQPTKVPNLENGSRFDKNGYVVSDSSDVKKELASNSDKSEGDNNDETFDLGQLAILLDSAYQRQVSYALNVIGKIAYLANSGFYDGAFSENIQSLLLKYYLLRVRHQMDNKDQTTRFAAFKCMADLVCNTDIEEPYLDRIYTIICDSYDLKTISLKPLSANQTPDEIDKLTDQEYAQLDTVMCLITRTKILERFSYILNDRSDPRHEDYLECIIDLLIRFARNSIEACTIMNQQEFLNILVDSCFPKVIESNYQRTICFKTLKFFRLIARAQIQCSKTNTRIAPKNSIPKTIAIPLQNCFLIGLDEIEERRHLIPLNIEAMRLIKELAQIKEFRSTMTDLMIFAQNHIFNQVKQIERYNPIDRLPPVISLDWQLHSQLIDLCGWYKENSDYYCQVNYVRALLQSQVLDFFCRSLNMCIRHKIVPHLDVSIAMVTAFKYLEPLNNDVINDFLADFKPGAANTNFLRMLVSEMSENSCLKNFSVINGRRRDASCLPSIGIINFNLEEEHKSTVNPLLNTYSPFLLLNMFINKLYKSSRDETFSWLDDLNFVRYIKQSISYEHLPISHEREIKLSLLAQQEARLVGKMIILQHNHYKSYYERQIDGEFDEGQTGGEFEDVLKFQTSKKDSYSNICYNTIALLGLLDGVPNIDMESHELKTKLMTEILFKDKFQFTFVRENSKMESRKDETDLNRWRKIFFQTTKGDKLVYELDNHKNDILFPLYQCLPLENRFWIMEPLIYYYKITTDAQKNGIYKGDGTIFKKNLKWLTQTSEICTFSDSHIIATALNFHFMVLLYCHEYRDTIVRFNVEDFLCSIGLMFLDDNIFLEEHLSTALMEILRVIMNDCLELPNKKIQIPFKSAKKRIQPIDLPLGDFFEKLVEQYEAASYGDQGFSNYLLLFITPESDIIFRKKLFQEKAETCLAYVRVSADDLFCPKKLFYTVIEEDPEMKMLLRSAKVYFREHTFLLEYVKTHLREVI